MLSKLLNASKYFSKDSRIKLLSKYLYSPFLLKSDLSINSDQFNENPKSKESTGRFKNWTGKNSYKLGLLILGLSGVSVFSYSLAIYGPEQRNPDGTYIDDEYSALSPLIAYPCRVVDNFRYFNQSVRDPISDKLLPDPHPQYQPMTLVIEVSDILLHPEWTYKSGWKFKKRAGLELFLEAVSPFFEVVVFTSDSAMNIHPILNQIDPNFQTMHYRLYREATRYQKGVHIKDLSTLNRDKKRIIRVDWDRKACSMQPENTLLVKRWTGDPNDRDLVDLAAFLRMIATNNLPDVREGLEYYAAFDDPLMEFRRRCEHLKEHIKKVEENTKSIKSPTAMSNLLHRIRKS